MNILLEIFSALAGIIILAILYLYVKYRYDWWCGWRRTRAWEIGDTVKIKHEGFNHTYYQTYQITAIQPTYIKFERKEGNFNFLEIKYYNQMGDVEFIAPVD